MKKNKKTHFVYLIIFLNIFISAAQCVNNELDLTHNWATNCSYDITGRVIGTGISYFNNLGKPTQTQTIDIKTGKVWMSQLIYDSQGRAMFNSLSAPKGNTFGYIVDFIKKTDGSLLTQQDLETTPYNPPSVGSNGNSFTNTLGKYYSNHNDTTIPGSEYQDVTNYPYTRTIFSDLNPGTTLKTLGGNKIDSEWKQGFSYTVPVSQELYSIFGKNYFKEPQNLDELTHNTNPTIASTILAVINNTSQHLVYKKAYKTISIDIDSKESVIFTDSEGKTLAVARGGDANHSQKAISLIGEQGFVDIHIPTNTNGAISFFGNPSEYKIWDLKTELEIPTTTNLSAGFYRIEALNNRYKENPPLTYIDNSNQIHPVFSGAMGVEYNVNYYDYSINYYDKTGKLKETVQPLGFDDSNLITGSFNTPNHRMKNTFQYDVLGQLIRTQSPDQGVARFKYRKDGQIRFSQNTKQQVAGEFSYTNYDNLARPIESGVVHANYGLFHNPNIPNNFSGLRKENHFTLYDTPDQTFNQTLLDVDPNFPVNEYQQAFVASNVSKTWTTRPFTNITWYSYDIYGRVTWLVQYINKLGIKTINYEYDPVTSKVTKAIYQKHNPNEYFAHIYEYDTDTNQLTKIYTETENYSVTGATLHAEYFYYETGALRRIQYANQGVDYVYSLNGALKSINHPSLEQSKDPGGDPNDLFGISLDYYDGDYQRTNTPTPITTTHNGTNQYNGNLKAIRWKTQNLAVPNGNGNQHNAQTFTYNNNNWLQKATFGNANNTTAAFTPLANNSYNVFGIDYDKNGNILHLNRNMLGQANAMDRLTYQYSNGKNQLTSVQDAVIQNTGVNDIKTQTGHNYIYNEIGQLVINNQDGIEYKYNASGLVTAINKFDITNNSNYHQFYYNGYDRLSNISEIQDYWVHGNAEMSLYDFRIEREIVYKGKKYLDFCKDLASKNGIGLSFKATGDFEIIRKISLESNHYYKISFDAILKQLSFLDQNITLTMSILGTNEGSITQVFTNKNDCNFYTTKKFQFQFLAPTTDVLLKIEVSQNTHEDAQFFIDNLTIDQLSSEPAIQFYYDDKGKRIRKEVFINNGTSRNITYYVRDASGNTMGIYKNTETNGITPLRPRLEEVPVYGLSRLGVFNKTAPSIYGTTWNRFTYELTDHLGNVRATFRNIEERINPSITSVTDYYPFGMPMPNRHIQDANGYRYAYQGQEKDPETGKEAFELRLWDGRIGRWLTTDPAGEFSSPYLGMGNNPIRLIDSDGGSTDDEWNIDANGNRTWVSNLGGDNVQILHYLEGHDLAGQTLVGTGNFEDGLNLVDAFPTNNMFALASNDGIEQFYTDPSSYLTGEITNSHPLTGMELGGRPRGLVEDNIIFDLLTGKAAAGILGKTFSRFKYAFWSGRGTERAAISAGFKTLGNTRAGKNLVKLTEKLLYKPGSPAYKMWARLSTKLASKAKGEVHVFHSKVHGVGVKSIWAKYEYPALLKNPNVTNIIFHY